MQTTNIPDKKLRWDVIFFFNALGAAIFSFSGIAPVATGIAKGLCSVFVIFYTLSLLDLFVHRSVE